MLGSGYFWRHCAPIVLRFHVDNKHKICNLQLPGKELFVILLASRRSERFQNELNLHVVAAYRRITLR